MSEPSYRFYDCFQNLVLHDNELEQSNEPETAAASIFRVLVLRLNPLKIHPI